MQKKVVKRMLVLTITLCLVLCGCSANTSMNMPDTVKTDTTVEQEGNVAEQATSEPVVTEAPTATPEPEVTDKPEVTEGPIVSEEATPEPTVKVEITADSTSKEMIQIIYEECRQVYGRLNTSLNVGSDNLAGKEISIEGYGDYWYEVQEESFSSIQDIKDYVEEVFTSELAQEMFYEKLFEGDTPSIIEADGKLYTQLYDGPYMWKLSEITLTYYDAENIHANIAVHDDLLEMTQYMHIELVKEEDTWLVSDLSHMMEKEGPYKEATAMIEALRTDVAIASDQTITPLSMGDTVSVDLDGDGKEELIQVTIATVGAGQFTFNAFHEMTPTIRINDYIFDEEYMHEIVRWYMHNPDMATWYVFDVDVNDGYKEIGLYEAGPSEDPYTVLLRYEDGRLRKIGGFSDNPINSELAPYYLSEEDDYQTLLQSLDRSEICIKVPGDGTIYATQRVEVLETNFAEGLWKLQNSDSFGEAQLELQVREFYEIIGFQREDWPVYRTVKDTLQIFTEPSLEAEMITLSEGEGIDLYRYYPDEEGGWVEISYNNYESYGWLYKKNYDNIYQVDENGEVVYLSGYSLIDNMNYAD